MFCVLYVEMYCILVLNLMVRLVDSQEWLCVKHVFRSLQSSETNEALKLDNKCKCHH